MLTALTGRSFTRQAAAAEQSSVEDGINLPADAAAGRKLGTRVGKLALARAQRYADGTAG